MAKKVAKKSSPKKTAVKKPASKGKEKYTYLFGVKTDGDAKMRNLLGGKGANLAEMARIGLPVPPGFTITTEVCTYFYNNAKKYPKTHRSWSELLRTPQKASSTLFFIISFFYTSFRLKILSLV